MSCPVCGGKQVGKVGVNQFYCWNCFIEFNERNEIFEVAEDGSLMALEPDPPLMDLDGANAAPV
ncbi:conserved hypothetical protein [Heliomicrobium modesticaldum Ice1]|uniref:Uncharacterized protein n=1 Tax=Heliobacterium modesticaldum (strain ATCC 51547 / Ice1) TaxID=498761 RepID=B0TFA9_HELMI|nr:hypothetical protein [Heliomicrobium modesticaldum]ABZ84426.1 conserved hypothetical protein [Heliomicrobium modesticaldum Ice1]